MIDKYKNLESYKINFHYKNIEELYFIIYRWEKDGSMIKINIGKEKEYFKKNNKKEILEKINFYLEKDLEKLV